MEQGRDLKPFTANLLPALLRKRARRIDKILQQNPESASADLVQKEVEQVQALLQEYKMEFPYFFKVDAWRAYHEGPEMELWVLERVGWALWRDEPQFLYCMEGLAIPQLEDTEIISVNSASPPYLPAAREIIWTDEIAAEAVQVARLSELPKAVRNKAYFVFPRMLEELALLLTQMDQYGPEFKEFLDDKIEEYLLRTGEKQTRRVDSIKTYFRSERRIELFQEFLKQK